MSDEIRYYALMREGDTPESPSGLARRVPTPEGQRDEALRRDLTWARDAAIYEWERGEEMTANLAEISDEEASLLVEHFRIKWGAQV